MDINKIINTYLSTMKWKLFVIVSVGTICGLGIYNICASRAWSYLSDDPATCVNCHIMAPWFAQSVMWNTISGQMIRTWFSPGIKE